MSENKATIAGVTGSLKWVYHTAATLASWKVVRSEGSWMLTATVVSADAFRVSQRPLAFVAPVSTGAWRWPVEELQITGATLSARLGRKEK